MTRAKIHAGVACSWVRYAPANPAIPVIGCGYRPRLTARLTGQARSYQALTPNQALEPTAYSVRFAPASGGGSPPALDSVPARVDGSPHGGKGGLGHVSLLDENGVSADRLYGFGQIMALGHIW